MTSRKLNEKYQEKLIELNEREKQLAEIFRLKKELKSFEEKEAKVLKEYIEESLYVKVKDEGYIELKKWLKKHTIEELINATDKAVEQYLGKSNETIFSKIERIAHYTKNPVPEYIKRSRYVIGILRNRGLYFNENVVRELVKKWLEDDLEIEDLILSAKTSKNWTEFKLDIIEVLEFEENE
jgi:hypothetical protein